MWLKLYDKTTVSCPNQSEGCDKILPISDLPSHLQSDCTFRKIRCTNEFCQELIQADLFSEHVRSSCQYVATVCPYKGCNTRVIKAEMMEHFKECAFLPSCDHQCVTCTVRNEKLENELKTDIEGLKETTELLNTENIELKEKIEEMSLNIIENQSQIETLIRRLEIMAKCSKAPRFDIDFSRQYYKFTENDSRITWFRPSTSAIYSDYHEYPAARFGQLFATEFKVTFSISGYGWFGVGSSSVSSEGLPGYTREGWMICTNGRMYHNKTEVGGGLQINPNEVITMKCNPENSSVLVKVNGRKFGYSVEIPRQVYFVVSVFQQSVKLYSVNA
jgi:hypothetical protein